MKLEHKTIKYIAYGLIIVFFIVLLSQNNNKQIFEGLENQQTKETKETKEEKKADEKTADTISAGVVKALELEKLDKVIFDIMTIGPYIGSQQKYIDQSALLNTQITTSNTQYAANITNLKHGLGLDGSNNIQQIKDLTTNLDNISEHIKLIGLNLMNGKLTNIIGQQNIIQYIASYISNYGAGMKIIDDLKTYLQNMQNNNTNASGRNFLGVKL